MTGVRHALETKRTIYTIDEPLLRKLNPDLILIQKLCDVCAVGYGTVAGLAETLPSRPRLVNLEPTSIGDIMDNIRRVGQAGGVGEGAQELVAKLWTRIESVGQRAARINHRPRCFLMEWVDPPFCAGHWSPELVMKSLALIIAIGLGMALPAVAQTTDEKQESNPQPRAKTKTEENVKAKPATTKQSVQPNERDGTRTNVDQNVSINKGARMKSKEKLGGNALFRRSRVNVETGAVSHSTTLFRSGRETHESLSLHRGFRDRSDVHFSIGTHPREWSLRTYSIVVMDGFHYYLGDNGCSHPPYGFDRSCNYPDGVVFCE